MYLLVLKKSSNGCHEVEIKALGKNSTLGNFDKPKENNIVDCNLNIRLMSLLKGTKRG